MERLEERLSAAISREGPLKFDAVWYRATYPDVAASGMAPIRHFLERGEVEGRSPGPGFDAAWYRARYPDVAAAWSSAVLHFHEFGAEEGRFPTLEAAIRALVPESGIFRPEWYLEKYPDLAGLTVTPFEHFATLGHRELRCPSAMFDPVWYVQQNPDIAEAGQDPLLHFIETGAAEGRPGSPAAMIAARLEELGLFDAPWYIASRPEAAESKLAPLEHYLLHGLAREWAPGPRFEPQWYREQNQDVADAGMNVVLHYLEFGAAEGRSPTRIASALKRMDETGLFDARWYSTTYGDVEGSGLSPAEHYLRIGIAGRRSPGPGFHAAWYLAQNPDVAASGAEPLEHFIHFGRHEDRAPTPPPGVLDSSAALIEGFRTIAPLSFSELAQIDLLALPLRDGHATIPAFKSFAALIDSLRSVPARIIFASRLDDPAVVDALSALCRAANRATDTTLVVITEGCIPDGLHSRLASAECVAIDEFDPSLPLHDRAELCALIIRALQPRASMTFESAACRGAFRTRGGPLHRLSRLFALVGDRNREPERDSLVDLRYSFEYMERIYFMNSEDEEFAARSFSLSPAQRETFGLVPRASAGDFMQLVRASVVRSSGESARHDSNLGTARGWSRYVDALSGDRGFLS